MNFKSLLSMSILLIACAARGGEVQVEFKVVSKNFVDNLVDRASVERAIASDLTTQLQACFPPLDWTTKAGNGTDATLIASLLEDADRPPRIYVTWSAKIGAEVRPLHAPVELTIIKSDDLGRSYRDGDGLVRKVKAELNNLCSQQLVVDMLHDQFVRNVPLATHVSLNKTEKLVLIPLSWKRARLGEGSEFRLEYQRPAPQSRMKVMLGKVGECQEEGGRGNTQTLLESCDASGVPVTDNAWDNCLAVLGGQNAPPMLVRIEKYVYEEAPDMFSSFSVTP